MNWVPEGSAEFKNNDGRSVPNIIKTKAWRVPTCITNHSEEGLVAFGGPLGCWSLPGPFKSECIMLFESLLAPLGGFGMPFWRSLDFEGVSEVIRL